MRRKADKAPPPELAERTFANDPMVSEVSTTTGTIRKSRILVAKEWIVNTRSWNELCEICNVEGGRLIAFNYPKTSKKAVSVSEKDCSEEFWVLLNDLVDYGGGVNRRPISFRLWG